MQLIVTMGQAYRGRLEAALKEMGGDIRSAHSADGSTSWRVLAAFPDSGPRSLRRLQHDVTQLLWAKFPGAQVTVEAADPLADHRTSQRAHDREVGLEQGTIRPSLVDTQETDADPEHNVSPHP